MRSLVALAMLATGCAHQQSAFTTTTFEQTYLRASHNWAFRRAHPKVDRLFNAFDYGHAIVYETLLTHPGAASTRVEGPIFGRVTDDVLRHPPKVQLEEHAIGPTYATLLPEVAGMFEWAHMLHRQLYDVLADHRLSVAQRNAAARDVLRYYRTRPDLALSSVPKSMELMDGQSYSGVFRRGFPKYNGLLWSYHWLQLALYDAIIADDAALVNQSVEHFWGLIERAPVKMPTVMPMAAVVAPQFSEAYPEAAIIFDNLHALHDVVADLLATPNLSATERRRMVLAAARAYRDSTTAITSIDEWREMARSMGVDKMGGPALVRLPAGKARRGVD
jgi:hypothetical protein